MIEEHLTRIRSKEEESKNRLEKAKARAAEIVERAREDGEKLLGETVLEADERERSLIAAARRSAEEKISSLRADSAKRLAALVVVSKKNESRVIEMIMKEFRRGT